MSLGLTTEQKNQLLDLQGTAPIDEIAKRTGITRSIVRAFYQKWAVEIPVPTGGPKLAISATVRPLNIEVPPPVLSTRSTDGTITAVLYGDSQGKHEDPTVMSIVRQIIYMLKPALIVHMGDLLDCYSISRFDKDPAVLWTLQDEIDAARVHLAQTRQVSTQSRMVLLEGNHEDRLRRMLWGMKGESAVLNRLTAFQKNITWPVLLDLENLGVEFVPYGKHSQFSFLPKFLLKHGDRVTQHSAYTAAAELRHHNRSGASGHTHRLGVHYRNDHVWIETGCTCSKTPDYVADPNWQTGLVVLTFDAETGAVAPELVEIRNGLAMFRGNVLRA